MNRAQTLALVPARGGSKSIPLKNIQPLGGRPLIEYVVEAGRRSGVVDRICVSTDDERIAEVARAAGADVPFLRPAELGRDDTPMVDVIDHALGWLAANDGYRPDYLLLAQPTSPFMRPEQIRDSLDLLLERRADSAITVVEVPRIFHPFHVRIRENEGWLRFANPDAHYAHPMRQDDPPRWAFGNLYWCRCEAFVRTRRIETERHVGLPVDPISALDINTPTDWQLAEAVIASGAVGR